MGLSVRPASTLALLTALAMMPQATVASPRPLPLLAQSPTLKADFPIPTSVPSDTTITVGSSSSLAGINEVIGRRFENQFSGTKVTIDYSSSDEALAALASNQVDIAAIGRPLTAAEKAQGYTEVLLSRSKIALLISDNNPFTGDITTTGFSQLFQGEITNWSSFEEGNPRSIRVVDRPENSDIRRALGQYPVFQPQIQATPDATTLNVDSTEAVIAALGTNGIGYAIADHVLTRPGVQVLPVDGVLPTHPSYPFSQPLSYIYKGEPSPAIQAFLGYAQAPSITTLLDKAKELGAEATFAIFDGDGSQGPSRLDNATLAALISAPSSSTNDASESEANAREVNEVTDPNKASNPAPITPIDNNKNQTSLGEASPDEASPDETSSNEDEVEVAPVNPSPETINESSTNGSDTKILGTDGPDTNGSGTDGFPGIDKLVTVTGEFKGSGMDLGSGAEAGSEIGGPNTNTTNTTSTAIVSHPSTKDFSWWWIWLLGIPLLGALLWWLVIGTTQKRKEKVENAIVAKTAKTTETATDEITKTAETTTDEAIESGLPAVGAVIAEHRIILVPQGGDQAHAYWDISDEKKKTLRSEGGQTMALRLYDVTGVNPETQKPHSVQQFDCEEQDCDRHVTVPKMHRSYLADLGYPTQDGKWLRLAHSVPVQIPAMANDATTHTSLSPVDVSPSEQQFKKNRFPFGSVNSFEDDSFEDNPFERHSLETLESGTVEAKHSPLTQVMITAHDTKTAYVSWEIPQTIITHLKHQNITKLSIKVHEVTHIDLDYTPAHSTQDVVCEIDDNDCYVPVPLTDKDYLAELGYVPNDDSSDNSSDGHNRHQESWVRLGRSLHTRIPSPSFE